MDGSIKMKGQPKFIEALREIVREALDDGLVPPLQLVAVGCGDGFIGMKIAVSDDGDFAIHAVPPTKADELRMPVNIMVVDAEGGSGRVLLTPERAKFQH
jgi:hypothetical protein